MELAEIEERLVDMFGFNYGIDKVGWDLLASNIMGRERNKLRWGPAPVLKHL